MVSKAEQDWAIFRRYNYRGVGINEDADHIQFSQMNSSNEAGMRRLNWTLFLLWIVPSVGLFIFLRGEMRFWGVLYGLISLLPWLVVWAIGYFALRRRTYVDVNPTHMRVRNGNQDMELTFDQIRNIDVHQNGRLFDVIVWHGPVALYTVSLGDQQSATSFREAIWAAINMLTERAQPRMAATPGLMGT